MFTLPNREGTVFALIKTEDDGSEVVVRALSLEERAEATLIAMKLEMASVIELPRDVRWALYRRELRGIIDNITISESLPIGVLGRLLALTIAKRANRCYRVERLA